MPNRDKIIKASQNEARKKREKKDTINENDIHDRTRRPSRKQKDIRRNNRRDDARQRKTADTDD
jgi:hypothetical protein